MLIVRNRDTKALVIHTGDFRAHDWWRKQFFDTLRQRGVGRVDAVYLDTTYSRPTNRFVNQSHTLRAIQTIVARERARELKIGFGCQGPSSRAEQQTGNSATHCPLFVVGTYSVGKEKAVEAVGRAAGGLCYVPKSKAKLVQLAGQWKAGLHTLSFARPGHALAAASVSSHELPYGQSGASKSGHTGHHAAIPALAVRMLASGRPPGRASGSSGPPGRASGSSGPPGRASGSSGSNLNESGALHGNSVAQTSALPQASSSVRPSNPDTGTGSARYIRSSSRGQQDKR